MKILFCNKYNYAFSGTESYMFEAMELLRSNGHDVALFSMVDPRGKPTPYDAYFVPHTDFKGKIGWLQKVRLAARAIYSREARRKIRGMIAEFRPDVAHVRNIYHHLSPSILWELRSQNIPVVYHLNDFKVLCPSYNLVLRGEACEACKGGHFWHALKEKCYPGLGSRAALVAEAYFHKKLGTYRRCVDCFLAPSQFVREKFVEHGWDASKFEVLPHFQPVLPALQRRAESAPLLYFGRLSAEKGVEDLLHAMKYLPLLRLDVVGSGPELGRLEQLKMMLELHNVEFVGQLQGKDLDQAIAKSRFTVLPSHAYETLGKTILESHAHARAVVATDWGSRRELVTPGKTGLLYRMGDVTQLVSAIEFLSSHPDIADEMGRAGQDQVRLHHTPEAHYLSLIALYERLAQRGTRPRGSWKSIGLVSRGDPRPKAAPQKRTDAGGLVQIDLRLAQGRSSGSPAYPGTPVQKPRFRVAFIGGRGLISKYSGIETYYAEVGKRLAGMGHQVIVYCRTYFTEAGRDYNGMRVVRLPTMRSKHLETILHTMLSTLHVLTQRCDVVHYHALGPALFSFIPRLAGKKTVVTVQGLDWQRTKWGRLAMAVLRLGERAAVVLPNRTMVVSQTLKRHYWERHGAVTSYVPNGGFLRDRRPPDKILHWGLEPENYILFLGRFSPEKGCHLLVDAYEQLETGTKLVMAGAASYCDDYSRQLRAHASAQIKILDWVSGEALDELLTNAMMFVLPSDLEGLSLALLDAMGAGRCVLTSDVAENREAVEDAGFTFRRGDVADLADRLRFLIANPAVRDAAGNAAKHRVQELYQWNSIAAAIEKEYFDVMGWVWSDSSLKKPSGSVSAIDPTQRRAC